MTIEEKNAKITQRMDELKEDFPKGYYWSHNYGSGVLTAPGTTRTGYTFDGWYVSSDGGAEDKIYGDCVPHTWTTALYAHRTPNN